MINVTSNNDGHPVTKNFTPLHYTYLNFTSTQTSEVCGNRRSGSFYRVECWVKVRVKRNSGRYFSSEHSGYNGRQSLTLSSIGIILNISWKSFYELSLLNWLTVNYPCRQDKLDWNTDRRMKGKNLEKIALFCTLLKFSVRNQDPLTPSVYKSKKRNSLFKFCRHCIPSYQVRRIVSDTCAMWQ